MVTVNKRPDATAWYVRSMSDNDTHCGWYCTTTRSVHAVCGAEFVPLPVGWRGDQLALTGQPPDPDQICPTCYRTDVKTVGGPQPR
jgi:hypothetical protein